MAGTADTDGKSDAPSPCWGGNDAPKLKASFLPSFPSRPIFVCVRLLLFCSLGNDNPEYGLGVQSSLPVLFILADGGHEHRGGEQHEPAVDAGL